ncbi:Vacuolar protein sorting-associated protein 51 [Penicillium soppii]|uniref:Vacuolar protein sorting-associated protein 51 n=1 Tax=Penicillium soppii TaxID=69789 RepID=UPI002546E7A5|nr:Vacuolar protein sorting-associated protein 51 [Penicillium soppii]KAJ5864772.1 Vacuolar protein sorting-associated protein 51 [Penicillium soppii]
MSGKPSTRKQEHRPPLIAVDLAPSLSPPTPLTHPLEHSAMSTLSSPRPSIASSRAHSPTPASSRPSLDALNTNVSGGSAPHLPHYYNLKPPGADQSSPRDASRSRSVPRNTDAGEISNPSALASGTELDSADFDPHRYVEHLLSTSSLSTVLKAENTLVGDIRTLDGERKALVYDNYSKLIRAVETIGKMRRSMDERGAPLTMTKTLGPAIAFVAETAGGLIKEGEEQRQRMKEAKRNAGASTQNNEKDTVRWVLAAPQRLEKLVADGKREDAEKDWSEIQKLLDAWVDVKGVTDIRDACGKIMNRAGHND